MKIGIFNIGKKPKKQVAVIPATKDDLDKLRADVKSAVETPEQKEEKRIYQRWIGMTKEKKKIWWVSHSIKQRNRLSRIVNEQKQEEVLNETKKK